MAEILKTPKSIPLPHIEIEDPEIKKIFEEYNKIIKEFNIAVYSDVVRIHERLEALEP